MNERPGVVKTSGVPVELRRLELSNDSRIPTEWESGSSCPETGSSELRSLCDDKPRRVRQVYPYELIDATPTPYSRKRFESTPTGGAHRSTTRPQSRSARASREPPPRATPGRRRHQYRYAQPAVVLIDAIALRSVLASSCVSFFPTCARTSFASAES